MLANMQQLLCVVGCVLASAQLACCKPVAQSNDEGYNYPIPENPLTLTRRTTTTTTTTTVRPEVEGYDYPKPENPLTLPPKIPTTTTTTTTTPPPPKTTTTTTTKKPEEEGYEYSTPENPLTLPPKSTTTTTTTTPKITTATEGYDYPTPENPLTLPPRRQTSTTESPGYDYPTPKNPLVLPRPTKKINLGDLPICPSPESIDLRQEAPEELTVPGVTCRELPPCPNPSINPTSIDLRQQDPEENIPGVTCRELPICPSPTAIDLRNQNTEQLIPGVTCRELPPCPVPVSLDLRLGGETPIPGLTCVQVNFLDEDFEVDLRELPDYETFEETRRTDEDVDVNGDINRLVVNVPPPLPQTTPPTIVVETCLEMARKGQTQPRPGVNCLHEPMVVLFEPEPPALVQIDSTILEESLQSSEELIEEDQEPLLRNIPHISDHGNQLSQNVDYDIVTYDVDLEGVSSSDVVEDEPHIQGKDFDLATVLITS